jgi:tetratricopeptide (TPR) repeat protein
MKKLGLLIIFLEIFVFNSFGQTVNLLKRLDEDSATYAIKVVPIFENKAGNEAKREAIKPFIIGYFGWKAKMLTRFGVGKNEANQLEIARVILGFYDAEIDSTLTNIIGRAKTPIDWVPVSDAERKILHNYVFIKYGGKFLGFDMGNGVNSPPTSETVKWKYWLGVSLGELATELNIWYMLPTYEKQHQTVANLLKSLQTRISEAPARTSPELLANLQRLLAFGNKKFYTEAERDQIAVTLRETLFTTLYFADLPVNYNPTLLPSNGVSVLKLAEKYLERGKSYATKGDFKSAVFDYNESIKLNSNNGLTYYHRAKAFEELGRIDDAIKDYDVMIAYKTELAKAFYNRGTLYMEKNYDLAIKDFNKSLAIDPKNSNVYYNRGLSNFNLKNYDNAIADFSQAIVLNPKAADAYINRSLAYCKRGKTALAIKDQEKAIKLGEKLTKGCLK